MQIKERKDHEAVKNVTSEKFTNFVTVTRIRDSLTISLISRNRHKLPPTSKNLKFLVPLEHVVFLRPEEWLINIFARTFPTELIRRRFLGKYGYECEPRLRDLGLELARS
jgi:hypothetical protein